MHPGSTDTDRILPSLTDGVTRLHRPSMRSTALHKLVVNYLTTTSGNVLWIDARNNASTYALHELATSHRALAGIRIARAFTAYQHHSLVRRLLEHANERTRLIVAPCLTSLYADDDVPTQEATDLCAASLTILSALAESYDIPVVITAADHTPALADRVAAAVDHEITCEETPLGLKYATEEFETELYWDEGYWQTTIPYWVDLLGTAVEREPLRATATPGELAGLRI